MNLLGAVLYDPAGAVSKATSSLLAMTAFDTTNLRIAFTIPSHGYVRVRLMASLEGATTFPSVLLGVMNGATVVGRVTPVQTLGNTAVATARVNILADFVIAGLTPGAVSWDAAYGVEVVVAATNIKYGGPNNTTGDDAWGGFVFEVWDPKPNPTNFGLLSIDANGRLDVIKIAGTTQTARDIGASVLLSPGTGTGQLDITSGVAKANLAQILGTALTETAGQIAAGFKKLFDVASPVMTLLSINQTGDSYARLGAPAGASVSADVAAVKALLPTALVSGRMDASVGAMAANVLTASAINADAITAAKIADGAIDAATFAAGAINAAAIAADAITAAKVADGTIDAATFAAGAINAAAIAADAIGASELAADAVTEIQGGLATAAALATVQADTDDIQTRLPAALVGGRMDASVGAMAANVMTAAAAAADLTTELQAGLATSANQTTILGYIDTEVAAILAAVDTEVAAIKVQTDKLAFTVANQVDANVLDWKSAAAPAMTGDAFARLGAPAGASVSADVAAIQADTDNLQTRVPAALVGGRMDASVGAMAADVMTAAAAAPDLTTELQTGLATAASIAALNNLSAAQVNAEADAALADVGVTSTVTGRIDAAVSSRLASGSYTAPPSAATIAAAVWDYLTSAAATVGSLGKLLVDRIDAAISSRSTYAGADTAGTTTLLSRVPGTVQPQTGDSFARLGANGAGLTALGDTRLANLDVAVSSRLASGNYTAPDNATITAIADYVDTEVAAIRAQTDLIPAAPAAVGDIPTANQNADALLDRTAGVETGLTIRQWARLTAAALLGKVSGAEANLPIFRDMGDTKDRIAAVTDADGNRTAVTLDPS